MLPAVGMANEMHRERGKDRTEVKETNKWPNEKCLLQSQGNESRKGRSRKWNFSYEHLSVQKAEKVVMA